MGRIGMLGLCSFGSANNLGGCGTLHPGRPATLQSVVAGQHSLTSVERPLDTL